MMIIKKVEACMTSSITSSLPFTDGLSHAALVINNPPFCHKPGKLATFYRWYVINIIAHTDENSEGTALHSIETPIWPFVDPTWLFGEPKGPTGQSGNAMDDNGVGGEGAFKLWQARVDLDIKWIFLTLYRYQAEYRKLRDTRRTPIVCSQSFILLKTSTQDPLSFGVMAVLCDGRLILPVDVEYNESM